ncbi:2-aminoethanethiol dioxygenase-like protein, partial [Aphelenchoides avenae]
MTERLPLRSLLTKFTQLAAALNKPDKQAQLRELVSSVNESTLEVHLPHRDPTTSGLTSPTYCADVHENDIIHCSVFGFRSTGDSLPLHNHPHIHGFIRAIRGRILVRSYSWLEPTEERRLYEENRTNTRCIGRRPARCEGTLTLSPEQTGVDSVGVVTPRVGNVHSVTALEDGSAFFDLLIPGYKGNPCTYYEDEE